MPREARQPRRAYYTKIKDYLFTNFRDYFLNCQLKEILGSSMTVMTDTRWVLEPSAILHFQSSFVFISSIQATNLIGRYLDLSFCSLATIYPRQRHSRPGGALGLVLSLSSCWSLILVHVVLLGYMGMLYVLTYGTPGYDCVCVWV